MDPPDSQLPGRNTHALFALAVLKGVVEHQTGTAYFSSFLGYPVYVRYCAHQGWVTTRTEDGLEHLTVTDLGLKVYREMNLERFPQKEGSRAYAWNWKGVVLTETWIGGVPKP